MSTSLSETLVAHGQETAKFMASDCTAGDWQTWPVSFAKPFPAGNIVVVAMASDFGVDAGLHVAAGVPVIRGISRTGFVLAMRNSDCASGSAGVHWLAVLEQPGIATSTPVEVRTGIMPARYFDANCRSGDWQTWSWSFQRPLRSAPTVVGTAYRFPGTDSGFDLVGIPFTPEALPRGRWRLGAAVGVSSGVQPGRLAIAARNSMGWPGLMGMNFVAVADTGGPIANMVCDAGVTSPVSLPGDSGGNVTQTLEIQFALPFLTPPIVLLTASDAGLAPGEAAVALVGVAEDVSTHGFRLAIHNSDCAAGRAAFNWVALGCGIGCGAGSAAPPPPTTPHPGGDTGTTTSPLSSGSRRGAV